MENAIGKSETWWKASEVVQVFPTETMITQFHAWMRGYGMGRKRVLDTLLAATYHTAGITSLLTLNPVDFEVFRAFAFLPSQTVA